MTSFYASNPPPGLESFLIYDGNSNVHICNSYSFHLYIKTRDANSDENLNSGNEPVKKAPAEYGN